MECNDSGEDIDYNAMCAQYSAEDADTGKDGKKKGREGKEKGKLLSTDGRRAQAVTLPAFVGPALVGSDPCSWGPSYFCASEENFMECNDSGEDIDYNAMCAQYSAEDADTGKDGKKKGGKGKGKGKLLSTDGRGAQAVTLPAFVGPALVGSDPCTWGPSYFCASEENFMECNDSGEDIAYNAICAKYFN